MHVGTKVSAGTGSSAYVIRQVDDEAPAAFPAPAVFPSKVREKRPNDQHILSKKHGWRERAKKNVQAAKILGLKRRQAALVNTVTDRNCTAARIESCYLITRTNSILSEYKKVIKSLQRGLITEGKKVNQHNEEATRASNKHKTLLSMSRVNEIQYTLSELKSEYEVVKGRLSSIMVEKASIIKRIKQFEVEGIASIENEVQVMLLAAKRRHEAKEKQHKDYAKMVSRYSDNGRKKDSQGKTQQKNRQLTGLNEVIEKINSEKREMIATFRQSSLSDKKREANRTLKALASDELLCRDALDRIKTSFQYQFIKLQETQHASAPKRRTSQSIENYEPKSLHTLSLQKLRLAKPLALAKKELDKVLYAVDSQKSRIKIGKEMLQRLKNGRDVLMRVNKHSQHRLEVAVQCSDNAAMKRIESDDKFEFKPSALPSKLYSIPI